MSYRSNRPQELQQTIQQLTAGNVAGKTFLVTGATRGLGRGIAAWLIALGADLIVASRTIHEGLEAELRAEADPLRQGLALGKAGHGGTFQSFSLDLADLDDVSRFVGALGSAGIALDAAILNAGVSPSRMRRTKQGYEHAFGINFLGNFALATQLEASKLVTTGSRVVFVSSESHRIVPPLDLEHLHWDTGFSLATASNFYGHSKLVLTTVATELGRRFAPKGIIVHTICPGTVRSDIASDSPYGINYLVDVLMYLFFQPPVKAGIPVIALAALPEHNVPSYYFTHNKINPRLDALDAEMGQAVFEQAQKMIQSAQ